MARVTKQLSAKLENVLLFLVVMAACGIAIYVHITLTNISKALAPDVLEQQRVVSYMLQDLTELTSSLRDGASQRTAADMNELHAQLQRASKRLESLHRSYSFDSLTGAAAAHAIVTPGLQDIERWLSSGIAGYAPTSSTVMLFAERRAQNVYRQLQALFDDTNATATALVEGQSAQLGRLRDSTVLYLAIIPLLVAGLIVLFVRKRKTEAALQAREQEYRRMFESTSDGLFIFGAANQLVDVNPNGCSMFGRSREDFLQLAATPKCLVHPDSHSIYQQIGDAIASGEEWHGDLTGIRLDGSAFDIELYSTPYTVAGEFHCLTSVRDVTERKLAERELSRNVQELEAFADSIAHDLKAPLRAMQGFSQILLEDYSERLDDTAREYLNYVASGAGRMGELIDDLLAFSRLGRGGIVFKIVDIAHVVQDAKEILAVDIANSGANIRIEGALPVIEGHRGVLDQLLQNLFANAMKFTEPGTKPEIVVSSTFDRGWHVLSVRDNGIGIDEDSRQNIFDIFQRLHTADKYEGTGIGLAIVKKGVLLHGGSVSVEAAPNGGSNFLLRLPSFQLSIAA